MTAASTTTRRTRRGWLVAALAATLTVLLGSVFAAMAWGGTWGPSTMTSWGSGFGGMGYRSDAGQSAPDLPGAVVRVSLTDMGGSMMGGRNGRSGGVMYLRADTTTVARGTVSFLATNDGNLDHELTVLPLADGQSAGNRTVADDDEIDEAGSLGHASKTNGEGPGEGIRPGTSGWVTMTLAPGTYELVCNLAGHYAAGMSTELTVT